MAQELGRSRDAGDLVHEEHEQDVGSAEKIDREDARARGRGRCEVATEGPPWMSPEGYQERVPAYNAGTIAEAEMDRRAFLELLAAAPLVPAARAEDAAPRYRIVSPLRSRGRPGNARPLAGPGGVGPFPALPRRGRASSSTPRSCAR